MMLRNGQTYFEYLAVFTPQDISSILAFFQYYMELYMAGLDIKF